MTIQMDILTRDDVYVSETWDLSTLYPAQQAWEADLTAAPGLIEAAASYRGRLGESAQVLREAIEASLALRRSVERLSVYARLTADIDLGDSEGQGRVDRATAVAISAGQRMAWFDPELLALPEETLDGYLAAPDLREYRHYLDDIVRNRPHTRSPEVEELLAMSFDVARGPRDTFMALDNADLAYGTVHDEDGSVVELTKGRYQVLLDSKDREVRREAYGVFLDAYLAHRNTLASLHATSVRKDVFYARARGFESARESALFANAISEQVYDSLIEATRAARPTYERYNALRGRMLGVQKLEAYDMFVPIAPIPERRYTYPEAVELVLTSLAPLGAEYVSTLRGGLTSERWVDLPETRGKRSGAYSGGAYRANPVILMNWNGTLDHVYTLTHEAGHAMHSYLADRAQPFHDAQYPIFLAEVASTLNEALLTRYLLEHDPDLGVVERFALLNRFVDSMYSVQVRQTMFAEFELSTHRRAERGEALTLETLNELFDEVYRTYLPGVEATEKTAFGWSRIPHFYSPFYVYQYATGVSAGIAFGNSIAEEGQPATDRYLAMLRSGGRDYPLALLREAGVDLETPGPVRSALQEMDAAVEEMWSIVESGALDEAMAQRRVGDGSTRG